VSESTSEQQAPGTGRLIQIDQKEVKGHLDAVVRETVEATLNGLDAEADRLCGAARYERSAERVDRRAGSYERQLQTRVGEVTLKVPKLRTLPFEAAVDHARSPRRLRGRAPSNEAQQVASRGVR